MTSSTLPLSLLAKGIGQVVTNGHEKLEVYLEPEDYYNLKSYSPYHLATLQENGHSLDVRDAVAKSVPLHKTFVTRKGALLIFSEELAIKAIAEEERKLKHAERAIQKHAEEAEEADSERGSDDPLRTVHDLKVAILMYGNRPDYRKKGDDLYLRFMHEARAPKDERRIRPGFSPKRYITAWSRHWHGDTLQKLRTSGLVQDKTLYRQNPLLPHLYQPAAYNLSNAPAPYRVTKNMLRAGDIGTYDHQRSQRQHQRAGTTFDHKEKAPLKSDFSHMRREPPPSLSHSQLVKRKKEQEQIPIGSIQAVRFLETGEVEEVKYSELKPQEKQEILAELLATAWEHGKHLEEMLDLVLASNKPRSHSAASSSAESELMMDMHRAILSLAESPIQRQIREKQQHLEQEKEKQKKKQEREEVKQERKRQRRKKKERDAQAAKDATERERTLKMAEKTTENEEQHKKIEMMKKQAGLRREAELLEQQKAGEEEEKEKRREARKEARKKKEEERAARKREKEELARMQQEDEEQRHLEEKRKKEERREERRRQRAERKQQQKQEEEERHAAVLKQQQATHSQPTHDAASQDGRHGKRKAKEKLSPRGVAHDTQLVPTQPDVTIGIHAIPSTEWEDDQLSQDSNPVAVEYVTAVLPSQSDNIPKSRPLPTVPQNTPATQQRVVRLQRQLPLENVIYEAKSKRSHASSSTASSSKSQRRITSHPGGTVVSSGDGQFATYTKPQKIISQQQQPKGKLRKLSPIQRTQAIAVKPAKSHASTHSSGKSMMFPADLPGDTASSHGKSSFYGGAMPITSNIVKQTLSDNISILSVSQDYSASGSVHGKTVSERSAQPVAVAFADQYDVPIIGVEPPTPIQATSAMAKQSAHVTMVPSPVSSPSSGVRSVILKKVPEKGSSTEFSNESDDEPYLSDQSSRSVPKSNREEAAVIFTKKSSTTLTNEGSSGAKYTLKGMKGPGSQSSAAALSLKTGSKKSSSTVTRGSVPYALSKHKEAAIFMPDQKIMDVARKPEPSSTTDQSSLDESAKESFAAPVEPPVVLIKSSLKDVSVPDSSVKSERRVSFQEDREETSSEEEEEDEDSEEDSVEDESEKEKTEWPQVTQDLRPISSRSAKLTEHAQKVAQIVLSGQRPDSKLEEDATEAVKVWNKLTKSEEDSSSEVESEEEDETEEEEETESSAGWNAAEVQEEDIIKQANEVEEKEETVKEKKGAKKMVEKVAPKEIVARKVPQAPDAPSVKSYKSTSSGRTSISSIQEAFVKEVKRKASELGINEKELQFEAELVDKVFKSTVEPDEVEVFHDITAGKHVVRSRHSSVTTKSIKTDTTDTTATEEAKLKQKYVVDTPVQEARSASPQHSVSTVTSTSASPTSPSRLRALSQSSQKSSIPAGDKDVSLEYQVTSYEGKLGDPKPEEPTLVLRQKIEPEKLDKVAKDDLVQKDDKAGKKQTKEDAQKAKKREKAPKVLADPHDTKEKDTVSSTHSGISTEKDEKVAGKLGKKAGRKAKEKDKTTGAVAKKKTETNAPAASPVKPRPKTPEVPFVAGRAKQDKVPKGLQPTEQSTTPKPKKGKGTQSKTKQEPKTQVELEEKMKPPEEKVSEADVKSKKSGKKAEKEQVVDKKPKSPEEVVVAPSPVKESPARTQSETPDDDLDLLSPIQAASPEDDYTFVRVEESPVPSEPEPPAIVEQEQEETKSQTSDQTAPTEATEKTDNSEELLRAAEEEEAKLAKKREKEEKRFAGAEKRRLEVERKRKEKEEQSKREKEEQERQEALKEEFENERRRRTEAVQRKKEDAEREKMREQEEEELKLKREEQQRERELRIQEEHKRKVAELQRRKKEEEEKKAELARIKEEEEEIARKEEEELMAQMAEDERIEYEQRKLEEAEAKRIMAEERRLREEEGARIAMEQARLQAIIRTKQQAALEEKLKFVREFFVEANGMDQTQNVNRAFAFSYFELLQLLGLEYNAENADL